MRIEEILALPAVQRLICEAKETMTETSCFDGYVAEAFGEGMLYQMTHIDHDVYPKPCMMCGTKPNIIISKHEDGVVASVCCPRFKCGETAYIRRVGPTFDDAIGRAVAAWNDIQVDDCE